MKIGLVLPGFCANESDWCIPALYNLVRALAPRDEVHVFALEYPYRRDRHSFFGARVHAMGGAHRGKVYAPKLWGVTLGAILAEHRRARFDLLHAFWVNKPAVIAGVASKILKLPFVASVAGGELVGLRHIGYGGQSHRVERAMIGWAIKRADAVTVGSRYLQGIAARWRSDVRLVPLGVDTVRFAVPIAPRLNVTRIINVGSLSAVKSQDVLIDAFSRLDSNLQLEIVGAGDREESLRTRAKRLGIESRVQFSGAIEHSLLPRKYQDAGVFVQSSLHEAQGMAVLEAAATGLTIAGTSVGVLTELAVHGAAIAAKAFDTPALASAIECAIEARQKPGCRAREIAERDFSIEKTCAGWRDLYNATLARR